MLRTEKESQWHCMKDKTQQRWMLETRKNKTCPKYETLASLLTFDENNNKLVPTSTDSCFKHRDSNFHG